LIVRRRRWIVPEVIQTSAMDCGPASLKALLEGFGVHVSYGRLREACQTDVDGTSIDTLEEIAKQLGLVAEQVMVPLDNLLLPEAKALPAIVVMRLPSGFTHFVVVWNRVGDFVQVMDPAVGRRWIRARRLLEEVYVHTTRVPTDAFEAWTRSEDFRAPLRARIAALGAGKTYDLDEESDWRDAAALDASLRMVQSVVDGGGLRPGARAAGVVASLRKRALKDEDSVPDPCWTARAVSDAEVRLRGAVIIRIEGVRERPASDDEPVLPPELVAALKEQPSRPGRELLRLLTADGALAPAVLAVSIAFSVVAAATQVLLFRALFGVGGHLKVFEQRVVAIAALIIFSVLSVALDFPISSGLLGLGRRLETRLRVAFLAKMPRLEDRYFASRPSSDMADRSHAVHTLRQLPVFGGQIVKAFVDLVVTVIGITWLDLGAGALAACAAVCAVAVPLLARPVVAERDMRARSHLGAIGKFYLDAMLGLAPVRLHGAERAVRREHEALIVEWTRAARRLIGAVVTAEGIQSALTYGWTVVLVFAYVARQIEPAGVLLVLYWALNIPAIGQEFALLVRQYPGQRNTTLRLLEPLGAREVRTPKRGRRQKRRSGEGVELVFNNVSLVASGHSILEGVSLLIPARSHVAIVGASGAGKSSLVGALLGWHAPSSGKIFVDGVALDKCLSWLRRRTAWVDPAVHLWNGPLLDNLTYGARQVEAFAAILDAADLHSVLESLPDGLQTSLGESGALLSGGEGQKVRLGRGFVRRDARLVILDEPFRGLDRETRRKLLDRTREWFRNATILCVTHDITETLGFPRVLVVDGGRIVQDGVPVELARLDGSYQRLLAAERLVHDKLWSAATWRRLRVVRGSVVEDPPWRDGSRGNTSEVVS